MAPRRSDVAHAAEYAFAALDDMRSYLRIGSPAAMASAVTRSHVGDFRCVGWYGPVPEGWAIAVDAEISSAAVPDPLSSRFGVDRFWERWTLAECLCKLAGVPMLAWWRRNGLEPPRDFTGVWRTVRVHDLVISAAFAPARTI